VISYCVKKILFFRLVRTLPDGTEIRGGGTTYENNFVNILKQNPNLQIDTKSEISPINNGFKPMLMVKKWGYYKRVLKQQGQHDYIFVLAHNFLFLWFSGLFKRHAKVIAFYHHPSWLQFHGIRRVLLKHMQIRFLRKCHTVIFACTPTFAEAKYMKHRKPVLIDNAIVRLDKLPNELKVPNRISFVGRIIKTKGITELVKSLAIVKKSVPDFDMQLVGEYAHNPKYVAKVRKLISKHNLENNITLCGGLSNEDKNKILASSQFFVFPSHIEGYGLVISEAMQLSLPVVAWNTSAMPYTVKHEQNGLLVKHNHIKGFADAIIRLFSDKELLAKLSAGAKKSFEQTPTSEDFKRMVADFGRGIE